MCGLVYFTTEDVITVDGSTARLGLTKEVDTVTFVKPAGKGKPCKNSAKTTTGSST
jgi:hypothetical protein